jgi:N-acylneuraminate cytidylyltransferase
VTFEVKGQFLNMTKKPDVLCLINARGGSKGVPGKNIKKLMGKPLIHYTIEAARKLFSDEQIIVSTDDLNIKACAEQTGLNVPFIRPAELATDTASTIDVLLHALNFSEVNQYFPDTLILLQATSPLRNANHIKEALNLYNETIDMVVSVKETESNPYYVLFEENVWFTDWKFDPEDADEEEELQKSDSIWGNTYLPQPLIKALGYKS